MWSLGVRGLLPTGQVSPVPPGQHSSHQWFGSLWSSRSPHCPPVIGPRARQYRAGATGVLTRFGGNLNHERNRWSTKDSVPSSGLGQGRDPWRRLLVLVPPRSRGLFASRIPWVRHKDMYPLQSRPCTSSCIGRRIWLEAVVESWSAQGESDVVEVGGVSVDDALWEVLFEELLGHAGVADLTGHIPEHYKPPGTRLLCA